MKTGPERAAVSVPVAALAAAAGAASLLGIGAAIGFRTDAAEDVFLLTFIGGWLLLVVSAIISGGYAALLLRRALARRKVQRLQVGLALSALALVAAVIAIFPLWGADSGSG